MSEKKLTMARACGPSTAKCRCQCPDGPCEHKFDGPGETIEFDGGAGGWTATCSHCGMEAMHHDLWVGE